MLSKSAFAVGITVAAVVTILIVPTAGRSQNATSVAPEIGSEAANWGLAPFAAFPP
jgi:hypothetical protein